MKQEYLWYKVSRRTLYSWKRLYLDSGGNTDSLNNKSRAPTSGRTRQAWEAGVREHLITLHRQFPAIGFEKLRIILLDWCEPRSLAFLAQRRTIRGIFEHKILAEAVRFELTEDLHPRQFSRLLHSTTLPRFLTSVL